MLKHVPVIGWPRVAGIVLVVLACLVAAGAGLLIAAGLIGGAGRTALWIGLGSLVFGFAFVTIGLFLVNRAYKWHGAWPWVRGAAHDNVSAERRPWAS